jgi:hypothetical protein
MLWPTLLPQLVAKLSPQADVSQAWLELELLLLLQLPEVSPQLPEAAPAGRGRAKDREIRTAKLCFMENLNILPP